MKGHRQEEFHQLDSIHSVEINSIRRYGSALMDYKTMDPSS